MTLIVAVILTKVRTCNRPVTVIPELNSGQALTKVRIYRFLTLITILNQVQNDANRNRHSDESQNHTLPEV